MSMVFVGHVFFVGPIQMLIKELSELYICKINDEWINILMQQTTYIWRNIILDKD